MAKNEPKNAEEYADLIVHHNVGKTAKPAPQPELEPEDPEGMIPHN